MTVLRFYSSKLWAAWVHEDHVHIVYYDGSETRGYAPDDDAFRLSALQLGYLTRSRKADTYWHIVEHDLCHAMLAEGVDKAPSASLWNQGHDPKAYRRRLTGWIKEAVERDEARVGALQAALNGKDWGTDRLIELCGPVRAGTMLESVKEKLRPQGEAMTSAWANRTLKRIEAGVQRGPLPVGWERRAA